MYVFMRFQTPSLDRIRTKANKYPNILPAPFVLVLRWPSADGLFIILTEPLKRNCIYI